MHKIKLLSLIIIALCLGISGCGDEDNKASQVEFSVIPESPIVINADITINQGADDEEVVSAPWFPFVYSVTNNSDETVTVVVIDLELTFTENGSSGNSDFALTGAEIDDDQFFLFEVEEGETFESTTIWYIGGFADPDNIDNFSVRVKGTATGWFGDSSNPNERFENSFNFTTQ